VVIPLRLGSFNLFSGRSLVGEAIEPERLVESIQLLDVDLLAIQEVDRFQVRSGGIDQAAVAAATLGAVTSRFVATVDGTPGEAGWLPSGVSSSGATSSGVSSSRFSTSKSPATDPAALPEAAQYGVALISRLPVADWHVLRLAPARGRFPIPIPSRPPRFLWVNDEPRVAIAAVLESPRITVACTHLSFVPLVNVRQLRAVRRWLAELPGVTGPRVLLGDLNLPGSLARRITGWTPLLSSPTFPSPAPRLQLDHVLASGLPVGTRVESRVLQLPISDHRAVQADVYLPNQLP
jgi:endonuclease/exonuclease/phosphatase family metal-dependent hydrolase